MSLSDQIKQPGQIIGSGGGGGGSTDAGDLTTGQVALARGGTNADLSATGGSGHVLKQASAGANITVGALAASDIASGTVATARLGSGTADNTTFLRGDQTWAAPSDATKLPLAGGTMSGPLVVSATNVQLTGSGSSAGTTVENFFRNSSGYSVWNVNDRFLITRQGVTTFQHVPTVGTEFYSSAGTFSLSIAHSAPGGSTRGIHCNGGTTDLYANVPTGGNFTISENGSNNIRASGNGLVFAGANSISASAPCIGRRNTSDIFVNVPTGYVLDCNVNAVSQATVGVSGLQFPTAHSAPGNVVGLWRYGTSNSSLVLQGPTDGFSLMSATTSAASPRFFVGGTGATAYVGATCREPAAVSLAAGATRDVRTSATTVSGGVTVINTTDGKRATFSVENGTPVKIEGDASFVAGAPGASQIGLELSSTTLRINNGYAGAKLIAFDYVLNG